MVSVHLSGELSGTVASARSAAERAALPVHVVDSRSAAMGIGFAALAAAWEAAGVPDDERLVVPPDRGGAPGVRRPSRSGDSSHSAGSLRSVGSLRSAAPSLAADLRHLPERAASLIPGLIPALLRRSEPASAEQVAAAARAAASAAKVWFLVDSLEHLRRGGRLSAPAAALGTVLGLRPLLTVSDGRVVVAEKIRTRRAARERLEAVAVGAAGAHQHVRLAVHHTGDADRAADLGSRLAGALGARCREVVVSDAGAVLGAHAGPGLLAIVVAPA